MKGMNELNRNTLFLLEQIRKIRISRGISQRTLAIRMGTKQSEVSTIETGYRNMTLDRFTRWANALGYIVTLVKMSDVK